MIANGADSAEAPTAANGARASLGKPEPWQLRTLAMLQQRVREAQGDLSAAVQSFAPEPGCSLVNGEWFRG